MGPLGASSLCIDLRGRTTRLGILFTQWEKLVGEMGEYEEIQQRGISPTGVGPGRFRVVRPKVPKAQKHYFLSILFSPTTLGPGRFRAVCQQWEKFGMACRRNTYYFYFSHFSHRPSGQMHLPAGLFSVYLGYFCSIP